jgi:hypothetical protein
MCVGDFHTAKHQPKYKTGCCGKGKMIMKKTMLTLSAILVLVAFTFAGCKSGGKKEAGAAKKAPATKAPAAK